MSFCSVLLFPFVPTKSHFSFRYLFFLLLRYGTDRSRHTLHHIPTAKRFAAVYGSPFLSVLLFPLFSYRSASPCLPTGPSPGACSAPFVSPYIPDPHFLLPSQGRVSLLVSV